MSPKVVSHQHLEFCRRGGVTHPQEGPLHRGVCKHWGASTVSGSTSGDKGITQSQLELKCDFIVLLELRIVESLPIKSDVALTLEKVPRLCNT